MSWDNTIITQNARKAVYGSSDPSVESKYVKHGSTEDILNLIGTALAIAVPVLGCLALFG